MQVEFLFLIPVLLWFLGAVFHYRLIPELDKSNKAIRGILDFVAEKKHAELDPQCEIPLVKIKHLEDFPFPHELWPIWKTVLDFPVEIMSYANERRTIFVLEGCRQNILVHALVHYIQFQCDKIPKTEKEMEMEAWDLTRIFFKKFHPVRYWILTIPYGIFCWWSSVPY